jgi:hypothetical protein
MPPSLKYRLIGGGTAWATSLAEARVHHPGRVDGPWDEQPWNIYLVGHGYTMSGGVRNAQILCPEPGRRLEVPNGLTLFFYCPEFGVFDSGDEQRIVNPADAAAQARGYRYARPDALPYVPVLAAHAELEGDHGAQLVGQHGLDEQVVVVKVTASSSCPPRLLPVIMMAGSAVPGQRARSATSASMPVRPSGRR